jgi:DegV family protein with EDD domain
MSGADFPERRGGESPEYQPSRITIVTDSTAYLPTDLVEKFGIEVVPLDVVIAGRAFDETTEADTSALAEALRKYEPVTTSRPGPEAFERVYGAAAARGGTAVVSVHLSADISGTVESAKLAAASAGIPVHVVDSRVLGLALGFAVISAAEAAQRGAEPEEVAAAAEARAAATSSYFYLDTLEYLRRGGRIGTARALLGSALAVKPLLHIQDGKIALFERVRTSTRAILRLEELAVARAGSAVVDVAVHHLASAGRADALAARLRRRLPGLRDLHVREVGAVVGAHVGPGMLGVIVAPRPDPGA